MKKTDENKASMLYGVESFLEEHSTTLSAIPAYTDLKNEFTALNKQLEFRMKEQMTNVAAFTLDKDSKRETLIKGMLDEATKVMLAAKLTGNVNLGKQGNIVRNKLNIMRDRLLVASGKNLYDLLDANLAILASSGVTAASQVAYIDKIKAYEEAIDDKSVAALKRAAGTRGIVEVLKKSMALLKLLKRTVTLAGVVELDEKMADASRIDKYGVRHYTVKGVVMDEEGAAVYKSVVKLIGSDGREHEVGSDKNGVFHLKSLGEDRYRVVVTHAGYFDYIKEVELIKGDILELEVVLELDNTIEEEGEGV